MKKIRVIFTCMGNICRSPLAHGVFESMVAEAGLPDRIEVESSGTHSYHVGNQPVPRSIEVAARHGIDLTSQRARQFIASDLAEFDYILAMDSDNYQGIMAHAKSGEGDNVTLFLQFAPEIKRREVPDPYYGGDRGFDDVYELVKTASRGLLEEIRSKHQI
jgi:protein-tyrosine phosphatase